MKQVEAVQLFTSSWEELKPDQFVKLHRIRDLIEEKQRTSGETGYLKTEALKLLCKNIKTFKRLTPGQIYDCFPLLDFIYEDTTTFVVRAVRIDQRTLGAPDPELKNLSFYELIIADSDFSKFIISKNIQYLDHLIATLYTREVEMVTRMQSIEVKEAIMINYAACRNYFTARCPNLFPKQQKDDNDPPGPPSYTGEMWLNLLYDLAETPAYQGIENAKKANAYEALDYLEKKAREMKNLKKLK